MNHALTQQETEDFSDELNRKAANRQGLMLIMLIVVMAIIVITNPYTASL